MSERAKVDDIPVLESIVSNVHLFGAINAADFKIMFAPNQIDSVANRVDVGAALIRRVAAIADRKVAAHLEGSHAATNAVISGLVQTGRVARQAIAGAREISAQDAQRGRFARRRSELTEREDVIENPVESRIELVDGSRGKNVDRKSVVEGKR